MQHRRPHSALGVANSGDGENGIDGAASRENRRTERKLAKERRGVRVSGAKRYRRVKRSEKYRSSPWGVKGDVHVRLVLYSFGLFAFVGTTVFKMTHREESPRRRRVFDNGTGTKEWRPRPREGEYNSDNANGSLLGKLRGGGKYIIPESMRNVGNKARWYGELRREYDTEALPKDDERSLKFVQAERERQGVYKQAPGAKTGYDVHNCPEYPTEGYPTQWPVLEVLDNWNPDDADPEKHREIYQGICIFDFNTEYHKALHYRRKELPFVIRNDPAVVRTVERWNHPGYLEKLLMGKEDTRRRAEYSPNNHFMYWVDKRGRNEKRAAHKKLKEKQMRGEDVHNGFGRGNQEEMAEALHLQEEFNELKWKLEDAKKYAHHHEDDDEAQEEVKVLKRKLKETKERRDELAEETWQPPTENIRMTYLEWLEKANVTDDKLGPDNPHWYFRLIGCGDMGEGTADGSCDKGSSEWLFDELTFFQPREGDERPIYLVEPEEQKGIHCRFGMKGVIAENHFDLSRNAIALLGGRRRYIIGHPNNCLNMNLLPRGHPSARHSAVDWSDPDLDTFPTFADARVNELVLQPGDVLYLPTNWFHYIMSLEINMQCNTRSGGERLYHQEIEECGF